MVENAKINFLVKYTIKYIKPIKYTTTIDFRFGSDFYKTWTPFMPYSSVTIQALKR